MKRILFILLLLFTFVFISCEKEPEVIPCAHTNCTWVWEEEAKCNKTNMMYYICDECGVIVDSKEEFKNHEYVEETVDAKCEEDGYVLTTCKNCKYNVKKPISAKGHTMEEVIDTEATKTTYGTKHYECKDCHTKYDSFEYVLNGYSSHGALKVLGTDLVDKNNEEFRLAGVSTFGLQWQPQYVNVETFRNLRDTFGCNVVRLSLYTAEGGYCVCDKATKEKLYQTVVNGINYLTSLDMYAIVDWHMLGADPKYEADENPLYFKEEAKEFFDRITKEFSDHNNILFEIMNEPSGSATWADCKKYAEEVIPVIRNNMPNAIILVGNPQWTSDLASVARNPLTGFNNIMYAFHFYAGDNTQTSKIKTAVETNKLPVFVTEHGGMDADGYGDLDLVSLNTWYKTLDKYNISHIAWSLANLSSSSCMFKTGSTDYTSFAESNLKEWGIVYRNRVRSIMGLPEIKSQD